MATTSRVVVLLAAGLLAALAGCGDSPGESVFDGGTDDGTDTGTGSDAGVDEDHIVPGGGTTGGPIDGRLVIWFFDEHSNEPGAGAHAMVGDDPSTALTGVSDATGKIVFESPSLKGAQNVHFLVDGYPAGSIYGLNAAYLTLTGERIDYVPPAPQTVTITGTVTGLGAIPEPAQGQFRAAFVAHGLPPRDLFSDDFPGIAQGTNGDIPANMVIEGVQDAYSLEVYGRVGALYAMGGILDGATGAFTITHLAVVPGFDPAGATGAVDVELAVPLPGVFEVKVAPVPDGIATVGGVLVYDLGDDGTVTCGAVVSGDVGSVPIPDLTQGPLAGASVGLLAFGGQEVADGTPDDDPTQYPKTTRIMLGLADVGDNQGSPLVIDDLLAPPAGMAWTATGLAATYPASANYSSVNVRDADGKNVWGATVVGSLPVVAMPSLPAEWGWTGIPAGVTVTTSAVVLDGDVNDLAFDDLVFRMQATSENILAP